MLRQMVAQLTRIFFLLVMVIMTLSLFVSSAVAQRKKKDKKEPGQVTLPPVEKTEKKDERWETILPYEKVITGKAKTDDGLFKVHRVEERYFFEIPDSLIGRELLAVTRIAKTASGIGYGGEELNSQILRWQRREKKMF